MKNRFLFLLMAAVLPAMAVYNVMEGATSSNAAVGTGTLMAFVIVMAAALVAVVKRAKYVGHTKINLIIALWMLPVANILLILNLFVLSEDGANQEATEDIFTALH